MNELERLSDRLLQRFPGLGVGIRPTRARGGPRHVTLELTWRIEAVVASEAGGAGPCVVDLRRPGFQRVDLVQDLAGLQRLLIGFPSRSA